MNERTFLGEDQSVVEERAVMRLATYLTKNVPPCSRCHLPVRYDSSGAVYIHEREPIDCFDNGYPCAADYHAHEELEVLCPKCGFRPTFWVPVGNERRVGARAVCPACAHSLGGLQATPVAA